MSDPSPPPGTPSQGSGPPRQPSIIFFPSPARSTPELAPGADQPDLVMSFQVGSPPTLGPIAASSPSTNPGNASAGPSSTNVPSTAPHAPVGSVPWQNQRVPSFFIAGADGRLHPHFGPPGMAPFIWPFHGIRERLPNPAKAAELLNSLVSVAKSLMQRIDKIAAAEDESDGWSCSICYEAADLDKEAVKALPCNHLFHEGCLKPWFASKFTCPTCRLDLDPLRTLDPPRASQQRPNATIAPRPHLPPYARPEGIIQIRSSAQPPAHESNAAGTPAPGHTTTAVNPPPSTIVWRMPIMSSARPVEGSIAEQPAVNDNLPERPRTPTRVFNVPLHASPLPMEGSGSASSPAGPAQSPASQRRPDISLVHRFPAAPFGYPTIHHIFPRGSPLPLPYSAIHPPTPRNNPLAYQIHIVSTREEGLEPPRPRLSPVLDLPSELGNDVPIPPAGIFLDQQQRSTNLHPDPLLRSSTSSSGTPDVPIDTNGLASDGSAFLPETTSSVSLETWTQVREKNLGWRCDGPNCLTAPSAELGSDQDMSTEVSPEDNEMLNVYSSLHPALPERSASGSTDWAIACPHRWHRACLDAAERSSGRWKPTVDISGRRSVRCGVCKTDGWVVSGESTGSEGEVERICSGVHKR